MDDQTCVTGHRGERGLWWLGLLQWGPVRRWRALRHPLLQLAEPWLTLIDHHKCMLTYMLTSLMMRVKAQHHEISQNRSISFNIIPGVYGILGEAERIILSDFFPISFWTYDILILIHWYTATSVFNNVDTEAQRGFKLDNGQRTVTEVFVHTCLALSWWGEGTPFAETWSCSASFHF